MAREYPVILNKKTTTYKGWSTQVHHTSKGDTNYGGTNVPSQSLTLPSKLTTTLLNVLLLLESTNGFAP